MATDINANFKTTSGPTSGILIPTIQAKGTDGSVTAGVFRGSISDATATNGADTTSYLMHLMVSQHYDDTWTLTRNDISTTAEAVVTTAATGRKKVVIYNEGPYVCFLGPSSGVTATGSTKGIELPSGATIELPFGPRIAIYAICATSQSATLMISEYK